MSSSNPSADDPEHDIHGQLLGEPTYNLADDDGCYPAHSSIFHRSTQRVPSHVRLING
jgi:hypothetical protein